MNLAEWSIRKSLVTWVITILFLVVGWSSFQQLSRLEDPEFTIKDAIIHDRAVVSEEEIGGNLKDRKAFRDRTPASR